MKNLSKKIFYGFCFLVYKCPSWLKEFFASLLGILWFDLFRIRRAVALDNIQKSFPSWASDRVMHTARASVICMTRTIIDFCTLAWIPSQNLSAAVDFEGEHFLKEALAQKKGVVLLGAHISNGDFGISAIANKGYKIHVISKRMTNAWLDEVWFHVRGRFGTLFIAPRQSTYEILKALKSNSIVVFVLDQFMGPPLGVRTVFFGRETGTAMGLALFVQKTEAVVLPCYARRQENGRYCVCFEPAIPFEDQGDKNKNLQHMTQKYTDKIEEIVRKYPEQWMWIHRRWKAFNE
jgi:Kdo2-lipid IVA lauroyltransferase/acyltransferase